MGERSLTGVEMTKPIPALVTVYQNQKPGAHCSSLSRWRCWFKPCPDSSASFCFFWTAGLVSESSFQVASPEGDSQQSLQFTLKRAECQFQELPGASLFPLCLKELPWEMPEGNCCTAPLPASSRSWPLLLYHLHLYVESIIYMIS